MWKYCLIELYTEQDKWPAEETPAEWIASYEKYKIAWCDGEWDNAIALIPLWRLLWWKFKAWIENIWLYID